MNSLCILHSLVHMPRAQLTLWPKGHVPCAPRLGGPHALNCLVGQNDKCKSEDNQLLK